MLSPANRNPQPAGLGQSDFGDIHQTPAHSGLFAALAASQEQLARNPDAEYVA
jgi:hypothetical protein